MRNYSMNFLGRHLNNLKTAMTKFQPNVPDVDPLDVFFSQMFKSGVQMKPSALSSGQTVMQSVSPLIQSQLNVSGPLLDKRFNSLHFIVYVGAVNQDDPSSLCSSQQHRTQNCLDEWVIRSMSHGGVSRTEWSCSEVCWDDSRNCGWDLTATVGSWAERRAQRADEWMKTQQSNKLSARRSHRCAAPAPVQVQWWCHCVTVRGISSFQSDQSDRSTAACTDRILPCSSTRVQYYNK